MCLALCNYHVVFVPKGWKRPLYGKVRKFLRPVFHELAGQRRSVILEGHMVQDHVHMLVRISPKYSVAEVVGYLKGKSAIAVARQFGGRKRNFNGEQFWARGYAVSTVGFEEEQIRAHVPPLFTARKVALPGITCDDDKRTYMNHSESQGQL